MKYFIIIILLALFLTSSGKAPISQVSKSNPSNTTSTFNTIIDTSINVSNSSTTTQKLKDVINMLEPVFKKFLNDGLWYALGDFSNLDDNKINYYNQMIYYEIYYEGKSTEEGETYELYRIVNMRLFHVRDEEGIMSYQIRKEENEYGLGFSQNNYIKIDELNQMQYIGKGSFYFFEPTQPVYAPKSDEWKRAAEEWIRLAIFETPYTHYNEDIKRGKYVVYVQNFTMMEYWYTCFVLKHEDGSFYLGDISSEETKAIANDIDILIPDAWLVFCDKQGEAYDVQKHFMNKVLLDPALTFELVYP